MDGIIYTRTFTTPLGEMRAAADDGAITGLWFAGQKYYPEITDDWKENRTLPLWGSLASWLEGYFSGKKQLPAIPVDPPGTPFQKTVWQELCKVPYGTVLAYQAIASMTAKTLGRPSLPARTIGGVIGRNPISLLIPCHRITGADGKLAGYAGGIGRKKILLELEEICRGDEDQVSGNRKRIVALLGSFQSPGPTSDSRARPGRAVP